jgi:hypothetical protein
MASAAFIPLPSRWVVALCAAAILFGLAAHLLADATGTSPDLANTSQRGATGVQVTLCSLLAGLVLPEIAVISAPLTVTLRLTSCKLILLYRSCPPPVHPPVALR